MNTKVNNSNPFESVAAGYDQWYSTPWGKHADGLEKLSITEAAIFLPGQRLLDIGCGTGNYLLFFKGLGLRVAGLDLSRTMLHLAQNKPRLESVPLVQGDAAGLPFADKSFDIVSLITTLEFLDNPDGAVQEALRVARRQVVIGMLNKFSLWAIIKRIQGSFTPLIYNRARLLSVSKIRRFLKSSLYIGGKVKWGSALLVPLACRPVRYLEEKLLGSKAPFGAFLVFVIEFPPSSAKTS